MILRVQPDFPRPPHQPGQYCTLGLGYWEPRVAGCQEETLKPEEVSKVVRRAYSISCSVDDERRATLCDLDGTDWLEFYIVLVRENPDGRVPALTPRLFMLKEGDRLQHRREDHRPLHARPGEARRHGRLPRHRHRRGAAQLHALGAAPPRAHGQDPVRLLRPLRARPRLPARSHRPADGAVPELQVPAADDARGRA